MSYWECKYKYIINSIITTIETNKEHPLTSYDVRKIARYQEKHKRVHPSGYTFSNFVTAIVRPKENMESDIDCYMVSDQCQCLERDGIFIDSDDKHMLKIKEPGKSEVVPTVFMESKPVTTVDPVFFFVLVIFTLKII